MAKQTPELKISEAVADAIKLLAQATQDAGKLIASSASDAKSVIANSAAEASKVVSARAEEVAKVSAIKNGDDHDLLQRLDTKFDLLKTTVDRIDAKDSSYITKEDWIPHLARDEKHETDIKELQSFRDTLVGKMWGIGLLAGLILSIISFIANHYSK